MKWTRLLSYFCLFLVCIGGGIYYFVSYKTSKKLNQDQKQEEIWETRRQHAQMLSQLHHYAKAELEYRILLDLKPDSIIIKVDLAKILYYQGKHDEALNLLNQIPADQRDEKVKLLIADIDLSLKHYDEAEFLYKEYLQQFPEDRNVQLKLAQLLTWQKKYEQSIELYQRLLAHDPQNVQIRRQYARALIWMGNYKEGAEELKKTLASERNIP